MRRTIYILMTVGALTSCAKDALDRTDKLGKDEKRVTFNMTLPASTRSITGGDENTLERMDVLAFKVEADGVTETFDYYSVGSKRADNTVGAAAQRFDVVVKIKPYRQRFVIITNAQDKVPKLYASSKWVGAEKWSMLQRLTLSFDNPGEKWNAISSSDYTHLPMFGQSGQVTVDNSLTQISGATLHRMVARINVNLNNDPTLHGNFKLKSVHLYNTNDRGHIVPSPAATYWDAGQNYVVRPTVPLDAQRHTGPIAYTDFDAGSEDVAMNNRIYLFETEAQPSNKSLEQTCVVVGGLYGTDTQQSYYRIDMRKANGDFMHVLRNHNYQLQIVSVDAPGYGTPDDAFRANSAQLTATVTAWNLAEQESQYAQYFLNVSHDNLFFPAHISGSGIASEQIRVQTNYNISSEGFPAGIQIDVAQIEYNPAVTPADQWIVIIPPGGNGSPTRQFTLLVSPNTGNAPRTAKIPVRAGNITKYINVTQEFATTGSEIPVNANTYVGAFWRADQTGERLIRIPITPSAAGTWRAEVLGYGDFAPGDIVFSFTNSLDGNVWTAAENVDMNTPANDATYSVAGNAQSIGGNVASGQSIFFRIGLKTKWSAHPAYNASIKPARYAVALIWYNNNTKFQKLYLRQGHEADYLMRPGDPNGSDAPIDQNRSFACKFIPYNLTAPGFRDGTMSGGATIGNHAVIPGRSTISPNNVHEYFTDYPSQAGASFQWVSPSNPRRAYHPTNPTGAITGWSNSIPSAYWSDLNAAHETCPPGYRRPNDGSISTVNANVSGSVASSEIRQSLWLNPQSGEAINNIDNSAWGYYADGFFDRRKIDNSATGIADAAVKSNSGRVAYVGRLFFNPNTNASLFLPFAGYRSGNSGSNGNLGSAGSNGCYWTSSGANTWGGVWRLDMGHSAARLVFTDRSNAFNVRCVRE